LSLFARKSAAGALALVLLAGTAGAVVPASAQGLVPADFFNSPVDPSAPTAVEANELVFDQPTNTITAQGDVVVRASGYTLTGSNLVYRRSQGELRMTGDVTVTDPSGNVSRSTSLTVTGGLKQAFLDSLTITAYDGARITADSADYDEALRTILVNAGYAPCGDCVDAKGRRIGWSMSASRIVQNRQDGSVTLEQPVLSLLGMPVAWLPYLWLPDLSNEMLQRLPKPTLAYEERIGLKAEVPFSVYSTKFTDIILTPTLLTRQGFLMGAEWVQRFDKGSFSVKASGLYQFDKNAFTFADARRDWRGAIQASGSFTPVEDWTLGFSYAAFTDSAYFKDYLLDPRRAAVNEVYATHLNADTYVDARLQQYNLLGDNTAQAREQQGLALPNLRVERSFTLPEGAGRIDVEARMLNVYRARGHATSVNGVPYEYGYAGARAHGMVQASWQNQWIAGGAVITPFAGLRLDAAGYDRNAADPAADPAGQPLNGTLLGATPIAALDIRYPLAGRSPGVTHLVEPIAQIVYRGASSVMPGITNEDSQSVVFDDTNLFSYNRFTGIDRQETGLRLNVGGRYLASFDDGNYVELVGGQSFQLAGDNVFALANNQQASIGSGLDNAASYAVLGAYGGLGDALRFGGKLQLDTSSFTLARAGLGASYSRDGWGAALNYRYAAATPATGRISNQHEIGAELRAPIDEYWSVSSNLYWDLAANSFLQAGGGLTYHDGYLNMAASATRTGPTHTSPNDTRFTATFRLLTPAGLDAGYSGAVPLPGWLK
jgi:LPS-assembly protein